jgi:hypothetical protein
MKTQEFHIMNQQMETAVYLGDKLTIFEIINKSKFADGVTT